VALRLPMLCYVGAVNSPRTHDNRLDRLRGVGLTDPEPSWLVGTIGLDLGAGTPDDVTQ